MVPDNATSRSGSAASGGGSYSRQSFQRSGWCGTCGLRRGADGRCSNCDAWWTSPLVQYGAPLVIASTFLLLMGVSLLRPKSSFLAFGKPAITVPAPRGSSSIPVPSPGSFGGSYQPIPVPRPAAFTPPQQIAVPAATVAPDVAREAALFANQQQLNKMAASVNSALLADDAARQQSLSAPQSSGGTGAFRRAAMQTASMSSNQAAY